LHLSKIGLYKSKFQTAGMYFSYQLILQAHRAIGPLSAQCTHTILHYLRLISILH